MCSRKLNRHSSAIPEAERLRVVLESLEDRETVSAVARRNGVDPRELTRWRRLFRAGNLGDTDLHSECVHVSELAAANQRIRDLEQQLGRMALENATLREAVDFSNLPAPRMGGIVAAKRSKR